MFTEETYREYLLEIYRKKEKKLNLLSSLLKQIWDDRIYKAISGQVQEEIRHINLMEKLLTSLSPESILEEEESIQLNLKENLSDYKPVAELAPKRQF